MTDEDLTVEESRALRALAEGPDAPAHLEDAVVARLAGRGLIQPRRRSRAAWALALASAAGVALFAAGIVVGQRGGSTVQAPGPAAAGARYVLLLYDAPGEAALSDAEMGARVAEYSDWAIGLRNRGADISGEKLSSESLDLGVAGVIPAGEPLGGYFVFAAKDRDAALAIARSCPHLKHGGRAELRPIEET